MMMRQQLLHGYMIHQRKYRERSYIVHLFSREFGRIDGLVRQNPPPQYQPICLYASGKGELKNFSKLELIEHPCFLSGDGYFAGFYLNELLLRLCAIEVEMPRTFAQYALTLSQLQHLSTAQQPKIFLKQVLRQFERVLLEELGYALDYLHDTEQQPLHAQMYYEFIMHEGFRVSQDASGFLGADLISMQDAPYDQDFSPAQLNLLSQLYRSMISTLLGDRPLKSRQLWISHRSH